MKKFMSMILAACTVAMFSFPVSAAANVDISETQNGASFEIKDVVEYSQTYGICADRAVTRIPIDLKISDDLSTDLLAEITPSVTAKSSGTLNFTVSGNFYRTSDNVTVSVYGLSGSFEYTGSNTKITGQDSYHNATANDWSGTHRRSTSKDDSNYHISVLKGDYTLYHNGKENNTAWIKIAVSESGIYSVGGDYSSYDVN